MCECAVRRLRDRLGLDLPEELVRPQGGSPHMHIPEVSPTPFTEPVASLEMYRYSIYGYLPLTWCRLRPRPEEGKVNMLRRGYE